MRTRGNLFCYPSRIVLNGEDHAKSDVERSTPREDSDTADRELDPTVGMGPWLSAESLGGTVVGDYLLLEQIGAGGGGKVYRAQHRHMGRTVAIKVLTHAMITDPVQLDRFHREVRAAAKLLHPHIVTAFDAGQFHNTHYLVMEFVDGQMLADMVRHEGPLPISQAVRYTIQIAQGLSYAHAQGIIHRDVKPNNVMVDRTDQVKILDMGLARLYGLTTDSQANPDHENLTTHGSVLGTIGYMSPEQIASSDDIDLRTDIYSLGCTMYFLLTARSPFAGTTIKTLIAQMNEPPPSIAERRSDVPLELEHIYERMVAKEPEQRQASMGEVVDALERWDKEPTSQPATVTVPSLPRAEEAQVDGPPTQVDYVHKAIGFDFGTTNGYVSWIGEDGMPIQVRSSSESAATPTAVTFQNGAFLCGQAALDGAATSIANLSERLTQHLGSAQPPRVLDGKELPPEVLCAANLLYLAEEAKKQIGYFSHLAYTVPGCFGDSSRRAYQDAFSVAGLNTLPPVNASTAVAIYFSFLHGWLNPQRDGPSKHLLVFRFGAGSFDATVFRVANNKVIAISSAGDQRLGGLAWNDRLVRRVVDQLRDHRKQDISKDPWKMYLLQRECEKAKIALTEKERVPIRVRGDGESFEGTLSHAFVHKLSTDLLGRAAYYTSQAVSAAGIEAGALDQVIMAGGASRMPIVRKMVEEWISDPGICCLAGPEAAPGGAALFAQMQIMGAQPAFELHVQEVSAHAVGFRLADTDRGVENCTVVIPQNTPLPATGKAQLTIHHRGQQSITLDVVEGTDDKRLLTIGQCEISELPPGLAVGTSVELEFRIGLDGTLSLWVESIATGHRRPLTIRRHGVMIPEQRDAWRQWLETTLMCSNFK